MKISIKEILKNMPTNLTDLEKVRYIYIKLGEKISYYRPFWQIYDRRFLRDTYEDTITIEDIENGKYENKIEIICKQIAEITAETINQLSKDECQEKIRAKTIGYEEGQENHIGTIVTIGEKNYYIDLTKDLYKIQKGMKTKYFSPSEEYKKKVLQNKGLKEELLKIECETISEEKIAKMDEKLGYSKNGLYMDDAIEMLKKEMNDEENWKKYIKDYNKLKEKEDIIFKWKIDFIFRYLKNNGLQAERMGMVELNDYYKKLWYTLLNENELKDNFLKRIDIHIKNENKEREESILYEIKTKKERMYYVYDDSLKGFKQVTEEETKKLENDNILSYDSEYKSQMPEFKQEEEER